MKRDHLDRIRDNIHDSYFLESKGIDKKTENDIIFLNYSIMEKPNRFNALCRGTIFRNDGTLLMLPFKRFFNEHEANAANINWQLVKIIEKIDGTMVSAWYDDSNRVWRLSTKKMIDELIVSEFGSGAQIDLAVVFKQFFPNWQNALDKKYWYVFELVSPYNRIVTRYDEDRFGLYLLMIRQKQTLDELSPIKIQDIVKGIAQPRVFTPEYYNIRDRKKIDDLFESKLADWEGVVAIDDNHNRIKIKQVSYVRLHHIVSNVSTKSNIINLILDGEQEEVLSYFPDLKEHFLEIEKRINKLKSDIATVFGLYNHLETQKEFALKVKDLPYSSFLFRLRRGDDLKYQFMQMGGKRLEKYL